MSKKRVIEIYEAQAGIDRSTKTGVLELLDEEFLPSVGDVLVLSRYGTGDTADQAYFMNGFATPFRVVEREFVYVRDHDHQHHPTKPVAARWSAAIIWVERLVEDTYLAPPPLA